MPEPGDLRETIIQHGGTAKQFEFWSSDCKWRAFVGGVGSGKTRAGVVELLRMPPGSNGMIVAPTYKMLADPTMETFMEIVDEAGLIASHNKTDKKIKLVDGKTVLYRSADEPDSLRGPNLGWCWLDEAALMDRYAWDVIVGRLRRKPGKAWITTTPKGFDWVWELFEEKDPEKVPDPENYHMVRCSSDANLFLPDDYIESLMNTYSGGFLKQEVGGEFTEWGKSQTYDFNRSLNVKEGLRKLYRPDVPLILCCDFNYLVKAWPVVQMWKGRPLVLDEVVVHAGKTREAVDQFRDKFPDQAHDLIVYGDAAGKNKSSQTTKTDYQIVVEGLSTYSAPVVLRVQSANPPPRDRINSLNQLLRGNEEKGIPVLKIDAECKFGIRDLTQCCWNKTGTDVEKVTDPEKREAELTHWTDALGYWAWREFPFQKPTLKKKKSAAKQRAQWQKHDWDEAAAGGAA